MSEETTPSPSQAPAEPEWLAIVRSKMHSVRYGVVQLVIHDGRVTQIESTEKTRISPEREERASR